MQNRAPHRPLSSRPVPRPGSFQLRVLNDEVTETAFDGHLTAALLSEYAREYSKIAGDRSFPYAIIDGTRITGYDPSIALSAAPALRTFVDRGGLEHLMVTTNGMLRMMASAISTAHRVTFRFFEARADAFEYLKTRGKW
jgi:hypothetical protein